MAGADGVVVLNAPTHRKDKSSQGNMAGADGVVVLNAPTHRKDKSSQGSMAGADGVVVLNAPTHRKDSPGFKKITEKLVLRRQHVTPERLLPTWHRKL